MKLFIYAMREFDELGYAQAASERLGIEFAYSTEYPTLKNAKLAKGFDAVSVTPCDMGKKMVEKFSSLGVKYFTLRSIGYEHVDFETAKKCGIRVSNTTYTPNGVANYAIMLMLMCLRNMQHILKRSEVQDYSLKGKLGRDISNCTVGVIGTGRIGTTVLKHLTGFGCRLLAYDVYKNQEAEKIAEYVSLDELMKQCDVITIHAPSNEQTYHIINEKTVSEMKNGMILVNTARGALVDTKALIEGIHSGKIGAAALDVLENENGLYYYNRMGDIIDNSEMAVLRSFPNVILSPHTAFYTQQDVREMIENNFESLYKFENGIENPLEIKI
jgi:lactate dehydrogenase-like 2-hydroxyacid dehydrogenase